MLCSGRKDGWSFPPQSAYLQLDTGMISSRTLICRGDDSHVQICPLISLLQSAYADLSFSANSCIGKNLRHKDLHTFTTSPPLLHPEKRPIRQTLQTYASLKQRLESTCTALFSGDKALKQFREWVARTGLSLEAATALLGAHTVTCWWQEGGGSSQSPFASSGLDNDYFKYTASPISSAVAP